MIGRIMKHEWRLLVRERLLLITLPVYALLIAYGVYNGANWKQFLQTNIGAATSAADANLARLVKQFDALDQGVKLGVFEDPRFPGRMARTTGYEFAGKTPSPTAAISIGQSDVYPSYLKVQWRPMFRQSNTDEIENPTNLGVGRFDLGFVLVYLYPLLIIALSFNILSSEREGGTQALLLSQPVSVRQFVLGKILLRGLVIIGVAVGFSLVGVLASSADVFTPGGLWRVAMWALVVVAYGAFWFGLAVVVNAFAGKSSTNALVLMGLWLALVLLVPAALNLVAKSAYPLPSRIELVQAIRRGDEVALQESKVNDSNAKDLSARRGEETEVTTMANFYKKVIPVENRSEAVSAPIFERFETQRSEQQRLAERLKYLSPAILTQMAMSELADSSSASFSRFSAQIKAYHQGFRDYFYQRVLTDTMLTRAEVAGFPRFVYAPESDGRVFARTLGDLASLALFSGVVMLAGLAALKRYPAAGR